MSNTKSLLTPDEQFIQDALREGRATKQDISMKAIGTPDVNLQAHVKHLDLEHCRRLEKQLNEPTDNLAPVVLFLDEKNNRYYLADGHHRHHVYTGLKRMFIPSYVIKSDNAAMEALEFATMCNREMCLGRTIEDRKKAIRMLLETETWWNRSNAWIAKHVGNISKGTCESIRSEMSNTKKIRIPDKFETINGRSTPSRLQPNIRNENVKPYDIPYKDGVKAQINGKTIYAPTEQEFNSKAEEIKSKYYENVNRLSYTSISSRTLRYAFRSLHLSSPGNGSILSVHSNGKIFTRPCDFQDKKALGYCIGCLTAAKIVQGKKDSRYIVLCYPEHMKSSKSQIDIFKQGGFEFMTPEELTEELKQ